MPKQIQLASNGLCLVHEAKRPAVLYRFGPAGNVAKVEPRLPNIDGFVPLFNGKDLTGWQAHPGQPTKWGVADGILTAKPGNGGFLYSTRSDFGNFHLRAEVRRKPGGSGGVAFRYTLDFQGYEVGIAEQPPGLVDVRTVDPVEKGNGRNIRPVSSRILQPAGEWYTLEIIAFGNQISVVINGKLAAKSIDANNAFSSGRIGLRDNNQTMEFRKIDIKELSSPPPPPVVASGPFVPLFNGKDLTGWTAIRDAGTWRVTDGILTGTAKPGAGICTTRNDFSDFHLRMETRINNGGTAFVHFRSSLDPALPPGNVTNYMAHICGNNTVPFQTGSLSVHNGKGVRNLFQKERLAPPGEWFTHEIIAKGNLITVKVNGQVTKAYGGDDQINSGRISLFNTAKDSIVEFRKIEIQETVKPAGTQFVNRGSGKGLGVLAESKNDGAPIVQWQAIQTAANQYWKLVPVDKEWFNIVNVGSGTCMSALGNPAKNARIGIWQRKDGDPTQEWKLVPSDANDAAWVKIVSRVDGRVLSAIGADDKDGAPVVLIPDVNAAHQLWKVNGLDFLKVVAAKKKDEPAPLAMHVPVPNAEKIAAAEMLMREQFSKEFSKKTLADYLALADRLHKLAKETADPAERYVLLREVRDLAVKAGKTELALKAAEDLIERYDVEEWPTRLETLLVLSKTKLDTEASKQFVDIALTQAAHARAKDQFDIAGKCLNVAETVVRRIGNAVLLGQVLKQEKLNSEFAKEHAEMKAAQEKLQGDAKDPEANLVVGSYWAFRKGDWQTGLPLLALSNNSEIQEAAKKDLAAPDDDKTRVELGEAWWNLAEKKPAQQKSAMQWRAAYWYRQAVPTLTGLPLSKASGRVKQVEEQPAPFKDITGVSEVERFKGHAGAIHRLALAADGKRVFSSGQDGTIREWNLTTGKAKMLLGAQFTKAPVVDFAISPDERSIAYLNHLGKLSVYDSGAAKQPKTKRERDAVPGIYWHATNSAISYTHFQEWSTMAPNSTSSGATFPFSKDELRGNAAALVVAPELDFAAILIQGGGINICRFSNSGGGRQFAGSVSVNASAAAFSKDAKYLVVGGKSGTLYRYDVQGLKAAEAKSLTTYKGHKGPIRGIVLTSDGKRIVSAADDRTARIWDTATGQEVQRLPHLAAVTSLVITRDDRYFVTACADGIVRMWKMPTEKASQP
jgi:tellurite resistance protein